MQCWRSRRWGVVRAAAIALALVVVPAVARGQQPPASGAVGLRIIVVGSAGEAQQILQQFRYGWDFAALAREKSTDSTAADGGYMGKMDPAALRAELRDALRGLGPGQVSEPIKIPSGYAILKVVAESEPTENKNTTP